MVDPGGYYCWPHSSLGPKLWVDFFKGPLTGSLEERKGETAVVSKHKRSIKQTYDLSRNPCKKYVGRGKQPKG